jgi:acetyl esterase
MPSHGCSTPVIAASWSCGFDIVDTLDPCFQALLRHPRAHIQAPAETADIQDVREAIDAPLRALTGPVVTERVDLAVDDDDAGAVPLRLYRASSIATPAPVIVFIHGGGFVSGSRDTHDAMCRTLCRFSGVNLISVEYRLAPEHPHPAAMDDCCAVLKWIGRRGRELNLDAARIALCGDSAGAYLAVSSALAMQDRLPGGTLCHIGLLYPVVDPSCDTPSMDAFADGYMLTRGAMRWFWRAFSNAKEPGATDLSLLKRDLSALPPTSIVTAGFDPLRDEGRALCDALVRAGVDLSLRDYAGMVHGFASLTHMTDLAADALRHIAADMNDSFGRHDQATLLRTASRPAAVGRDASGAVPAPMREKQAGSR